MAEYKSSWRRHSAPIITRIVAEFPEGPDRKVALHDAYPFGERKYHPYKIWLDEIARQERRKPKLGTFGPKAKERAVPDPRQDGLFTEAK